MTKKRRIFILEDDSIIINVYRDFLTTFGYDNISFYRTYDDAVNAILDKGTDFWGLYIVDLNIPKNKKTKEQNNEIDDNIIFLGFDFVEKYLPLSRTILVTGYLSPQMERELSKLKILMYFGKPVELFRLLTLINAYFYYFSNKEVINNV